VGKLERELRAKEETARLKQREARPQAVKDEENRHFIVRGLKSGLYNSWVYATWTGSDHLLRPEDKAMLRAEFENLVQALTACGVIDAAPSRKRRAA
jgi:hypothetical protein